MVGNILPIQGEKDIELINFKTHNRGLLVFARLELLVLTKQKATKNKKMGRRNPGKAYLYANINFVHGRFWITVIIITSSVIF